MPERATHRSVTATTIALLVFCLAVATGGCSRRRGLDDAWVSMKPVPKQAIPVRNWLQAIQAGDVELLKTVFSERLCRSFERQGWEKVLAVYRSVFRELMGDIDVNELDFVFVPDASDPSSGGVIVRKGKLDYPPLQVVLENGGWKVNER